MSRGSTSTAERLADALADVHAVSLAQRARAGEFDDFRSPHPFPKQTIVAALRELHDSTVVAEQRPAIAALARRIIDGEFDNTREEAEEWATSEQGRVEIESLIGDDERMQEIVRRGLDDVSLRPPAGTRDDSRQYSWIRQAIPARYRRFAWGSMIYACSNGCGYQQTNWLGVGCEGPGLLRSLSLFIPVPFYCGRCPRCEGGLRHEDWNSDEDFGELRDSDERGPAAGLFIVPGKATAARSVEMNYGGAHYEPPAKADT